MDFSGKNEKNISFFKLKDMRFQERIELLKRTEADLGDFLDGIAPIIEKVKNEGDSALSHFANKFDKSPVSPDTIKATEAGYPELAKHAHNLSTYEDFDGHARAVSSIRDELLK